MYIYIHDIEITYLALLVKIFINQNSGGRYLSEELCELHETRKCVCLFQGLIVRA